MKNIHYLILWKTQKINSLRDFNKKTSQKFGNKKKRIYLCNVNETNNKHIKLQFTLLTFKLKQNGKVFTDDESE